MQNCCSVGQQLVDYLSFDFNFSVVCNERTPTNKPAGDGETGAALTVLIQAKKQRPHKTNTSVNRAIGNQCAKRCVDQSACFRQNGYKHLDAHLQVGYPTVIKNRVAISKVTPQPVTGNEPQLPAGDMRHI